MMVLDLLKQARSLENSLVDSESREGWERYVCHRLSPDEAGLFRRLRRSDPELFAAIEEHQCFKPTDDSEIEIDGQFVHCPHCGKVLGMVDATPRRHREPNPTPCRSQPVADSRNGVLT